MSSCVYVSKLSKAKERTKKFRSSSAKITRVFVEVFKGNCLGLASVSFLVFILLRFSVFGMGCDVLISFKLVL